MTIDLDLSFASTAELLRRLHTRELSPVELVRNALERCEAVQPALNCFTAIYGERALSAAADAERRLAAGGATPPLLGIPFAIKDVTPTRGDVVTLGSHAFASEVARHDGIVGARLVAAGAVCVARTTTPELAHSSYTRSPLWGITRNPWDTSRSPGGSSGGSGAAVAAGCVPFAEGSDMGGSIRIPAAYCGVVGLKPSFGRIPLEFLPSLVDTIHHVGPLARTVDDARRFLSATQGPDDRDPLSLEGRADVDAPVPTSVEGLRLALSLDLGCFKVDDEIARAVHAAAAALEAAGAQVEEVDVGFTSELDDAWGEHWGVYLAELLGDRRDAFWDRLDRPVQRYLERADRLGAIEHRRRFDAAVRDAWRRLSAVLAQADALLCPTMARLQPAADANASDLDMTGIFNLTSPCPAISVPCGWSEGGLPIGLQAVARRHRDDVALRVAAAVERLLPWADRRPPV
jgi:Asp-tRNA(Asn)/Glu-tRNA(Gln) amidotransferase A subunit family amidase